MKQKNGELIYIYYYDETYKFKRKNAMNDFRSKCEEKSVY